MSGHKMKQTTRGLEDTHLSDVQDYLKEHADSILRSDRPFSKYMRAVIRKKGLKQRDVFFVGGYSGAIWI